MKNLIQYIKEEFYNGENNPLNDPAYQVSDTIYSICGAIMGWDSEDPEMVKLMTALEKINPSGCEVHYMTDDDSIPQEFPQDSIEETPETWEQLMDTIDTQRSLKPEYEYKEDDASITLNNRQLYFNLPEIQILCTFK